MAITVFIVYGGALLIYALRALLIKDKVKGKDSFGSMNIYLTFKRIGRLILYGIGLMYLFLFISQPGAIIPFLAFIGIIFYIVRTIRRNMIS
ncbi:hypothetical protein [Salirhabdus salicampi]|uniref:hypothetical protein n=1 Tax=Salirhabdus salicampi TaxID=476102 RepID=UPI0020C37DBD|nr:hypothetical protein [Salirhabdus salicampi]MCP8616372.1 hypothetical protein [Salirhabdus salicampi]